MFLSSLPPTSLLFGSIGPWQVVIILLIILVLFGNKLPGMARSLGASFVEFKKGVKGTNDDESDPNARLEEKDEKPDAQADERARSREENRA